MVLLLLVTIIPAVSSVKINTIEKTNNDGCDLKIEILTPPYLVTREPIKIDGDLCTRWEIKYRITNNYDKRIISKPSVKVLTTDGTERVIDSWYVDINLAPKQSIDCVHMFYAEISEDLNIDEERYVAELKYDFQQLKEWKSKEPWLQDIRVRGRVDYVRDGETVTVECQGIKQVVKEEKDGKDGSIQFNFVVPAKYPYKIPQKCVITVTGDHPSHQGKPLKTLGVLSYCFSGGEIYKWFQSESWRKTKNIESIAHVSLLKTLLQKLFDNFFYESKLNTDVVCYPI